MNNTLSTRASEFPWDLQLWLQENTADNSEAQKRLKANLAKALDRELTPRQREMLSMLFFDGLSQVEIAKRLALNPSTVSRTVHRGIKRLIRVLDYSM